MAFAINENTLKPVSLQVTDDGRLKVDALDAGTPVPAGGADGEVLTKQSGADGDFDWEALPPMPDPLPTGGATGQVLTKQSGADGDADWQDLPPEDAVLPAGGTTNQVLFKDSGTDDDASWDDLKTINGISLRGSGNFSLAGASGGDVVGPASAVNNHVVFWDGTSGDLIKDSGLTLSGTNTGDQTSVTGNAGTATALATARNINGVAFDGTANITIADSTKVAKAGDTMSGTLNLAFSGYGIAQTEPATGSLGGLKVTDSVGNRQLELLHLGSTQGGAYGAASGDAVLNSFGGNLIFSTADVMRMSVRNSTGWIGVGPNAPSWDFDMNKTVVGGMVHRVRNPDTGNSYAGVHVESNTVAGSLLAFGSGSSGAPSTLSLRTSNATDLTFNTNATERVRIGSTGNVGIGRTSTGALLDVHGGYFRQGYASQQVFIANGATAITGGSSSDMAFRFDANNLCFAYTTTELMRLNSSGQLGIGVTPSYNFHLNKAGTSISGTWMELGLFEEPANGKGVHIGYDSASQTGILVGATSSAASNLGFWTYSGSAWGERVRITSAGELCIGASSSSGAKLYASGAAHFVNSTGLPATVGGGQMLTSSGAVSKIIIGDGTGYSWNLSKRLSSTTTDLVTLKDSGEFGINCNPVGTCMLQVKTATNRNVAVLDSAGGTVVTGMTDSGSSASLRVIGNTLKLSGDGSTDHVEVTNAGQVKITGTGQNLVLGSPSSASYCYMGMQNNAGQFGYIGEASTLSMGSAQGFAIRSDTGSVSIGSVTTAGVLIYCSAVVKATFGSGGALRLHAYGAGTLVTDASGNVTASSDERLKTNIEGWNRGLDAILALKPREFNWSEASGLDQSQKYVGLIAQEVLEAIPEAVGTDPQGMHSLSDRPIMMALVNSVKELAAQNAALVARIEVLEAR